MNGSLISLAPSAWTYRGCLYLYTARKYAHGDFLLMRTRTYLDGLQTDIYDSTTKEWLIEGKRRSYTLLRDLDEVVDAIQLSEIECYTRNAT